MDDTSPRAPSVGTTTASLTPNPQPWLVPLPYLGANFSELRLLLLTLRGLSLEAPSPPRPPQLQSGDEDDERQEANVHEGLRQEVDGGLELDVRPHCSGAS